MRLVELLTDDSNPASLIKRDCGPFLKAFINLNGTPIYRGVNQELTKEIVKISPRTNNRRPSDTIIQIHQYLNDKFMEKFGFPFRNGIFVCGNKLATEVYGTPVVVFPIGDLKFAWSKEWFDLFELLVDHHDMNNADTKRIIDDAFDTYRTDKIQIAIRSGHEIMFANDCYLISEKTYNRIKTELQS
jgi:hypothetical protein